VEYAQLDASSGLLWKAPWRVEVEIVPTVDDAIPPYRGDEIDAAVRESLSVLIDWWDGAGHASVDLRRDTSRHPVLAHTALSLHIEVVAEGLTRETLSLVGGFDHDPVRDHFPWLDSVSSAALRYELASHPATQCGWFLRVSGTTNKVERLWDVTRRWSGTIEIPLDEAIRRGAELESARERAPK
jgi:hypothetical protein